MIFDEFTYTVITIGVVLTFAVVRLAASKKNT